MRPFCPSCPLIPEGAYFFRGQKGLEGHIKSGITTIRVHAKYRYSAIRAGYGIITLPYCEIRDPY